VARAASERDQPIGTAIIVAAPLPLVLLSGSPHPGHQRRSRDEVCQPRPPGDRPGCSPTSLA